MPRGWKNISVHEETHERLFRTKKVSQTIDEFLIELLDNWEGNRISSH